MTAHGLIFKEKALINNKYLCYNNNRSVIEMINSRKYAHKLIDEISESDYAELINFLKFLKMKNKKNEYKVLEDASQSSTSFWENDIDDEVWNDA